MCVVRLGLVKAERNGRKTVYRGVGQSVDLDGWQEAVAFFSEQNPLGVIGSYILDKYGEIPDLFRHKHHYMLHATDSEIICTLATAITQKRRVSLKTSRRGSEKQGVYSVFPYKIYISTQWGRQYLLCYCPDAARPMFFRTDGIVSVAVNEPESESEKYGSFCLEFSRYLWGVSVGTEPTLESVEAVIRADENEEYIVRRRIREKRCGQVESMGGGLYRFTAQVYDAAEMLPWLRTFTGRVVKLECSNPRVTQIFWDDLRELERMYGGGQNAAE